MMSKTGVFPLFITLLAILTSCMPYQGAPYGEPFDETPYGGDASAVKYEERGIASFMADEMQNKRTASGVRFNLRQMVAAHPSLPFGTVVEVMNLQNKKTVRVTIIDRGPFVRGRIIDVSFAAAKALGFVEDGMTEVEVRVVGLGNGRVNPEEL